MLPEFSILGEHFHTYPLMVGISSALAYLLIKPLKIFKNILQFRTFFIGSFLFAWLGAKILFLLSVDSKYYDQLSFWTGGGFVFFGGLIFGSIFTLLFFKINKIPLSAINAFMPALAFSHAVGRFGCFLTGCCYGDLITDDLRHPVQLYESIFLLLLGVWLQKRLRLGMGTIKIYFVSYACFRFLIEFIRGDDYRGIYLGGISTSQFISLFIILLVFGFSKLRKEQNQL